jgi:hypothetical protein
MKHYTAYAEAAIKASWKVFHCEREIDKDARAEYERTSYDELRARRFALKQDLRLKQAASDAAVADMLKLHRLCDAIKSKLANAMEPASPAATAASASPAATAAACCSLLQLPQADSILPQASEAAANLTIAAARADDAHAATAAAAAALKHIDDEKSDVDDELKRMDAAIAKATTDAVMAAAAVMARVGKRKLDLEASLEKMKR